VAFLVHDVVLLSRGLVFEEAFLERVVPANRAAAFILCCWAWILYSSPLQIQGRVTRAVPLSNRLDDPQYRATATRLVDLSARRLDDPGLRLFYLQIIKGSYHEMLSAQNSIRLQIVKAARGFIYDRYGWS